MTTVPRAHPQLLEVPATDGTVADTQAPVLRSLSALRRETAEAWLRMPAADMQRHYAGRIGHIHRLIYRNSAQRYALLPQDIEFSRALRARLTASAEPGVNVLLAAMLYLAPHEFPRVIALSAVPAWLVNDYFDHMMATPPMFRYAGEADAYCDFMSRWAAYLRDEVAADPYGESGYRLARKFSDTSYFQPVYFNLANVRDVFRARAELLEMALAADDHELDWTSPPRPARTRLKIGVLAVNFSANAEAFATLPVYRHLDRRRFEVVLFALGQKNNAMERFCIQHADGFVRLPPTLQAQVNVLREADLDLVYFSNNLTPTARDLTALALHRLARVQVAGVCSCVTTGMRNIDCYLSGRLSEPADAQSHYTEKLYMVDGAAHCYDFGDSAPAAAAGALRREDFGIPRDAVVFASGANFYKILPELEDVWLRILAAVPDSRLVLYPFGPQWALEYPITPFLLRLAAGLRRHGIDPQRLLVFKTASGRGDILQRLALADLYLDSFPFSGATSLLDPLLVGLPTVALDGVSFRSLVGPGILRDMGLGELVADSVDAYIALALRLATDRPQRASLRTRIDALMRDNPPIFDGRRYATRVGDAFEQMWRDYCAGGLKNKQRMSG